MNIEKRGTALQSNTPLSDIRLVFRILISHIDYSEKRVIFQDIISNRERKVPEMGRTIRVKVAAKPISKNSVQVRTSVSGGGTTKTRTQTVRIK